MRKSRRVQKVQRSIMTTLVAQQDLIKFSFLGSTQEHHHHRREENQLGFSWILPAFSRRILVLKFPSGHSHTRTHYKLLFKLASTLEIVSIIIDSSYLHNQVKLSPCFGVYFEWLFHCFYYWIESSCADAQVYRCWGRMGRPWAKARHLGFRCRCRLGRKWES